jgi:hypothetical protein
LTRAVASDRIHRPARPDRGTAVLAGCQPQARRRGWPPVVVVGESRTETSPAALTWLLAQAGGAKLGYPVVADATGRPAAVTLPAG